MENAIKDKWSEILLFLKEEYAINPVLFRTWIEPLEVFSYNEDVLTVAIDESKQGDILELVKKKYKLPLEIAIESITALKPQIEFKYRSELGDEGVSSYNKENILEEKYPDRKIIILDSKAVSGGFGLLMDKLADKRTKKVIYKRRL